MKTLAFTKVAALAALAISTTAMLCFSPATHAQSDAGKDALYVKSLAATCANCHTRTAWQ